MKTVRINERAILAFAFDCAMVLISWSLTMALAQRLAPTQVDLSLKSLVVLALLAIFVQGAVSTVFGMYRSLWRYASLPDVQRIVVCVIGGTLALALVINGLQASAQGDAQIGGVSLMGLLPNIVTAHFFIKNGMPTAKRACRARQC
jgi:FlaA1/EpsC-like NDP-sugar epimerase